MISATTTKRPDSGGPAVVTDWLRGHDLNVRPSGYEPDELPDCSTPRIHLSEIAMQRQTSAPAALGWPTLEPCIHKLTIDAKNQRIGE